MTAHPVFCPNCNSTNVAFKPGNRLYCLDCGYQAPLVPKMKK